ncbi:MAG: PIG-L family deacetylase [Thermoanaerobaculia bacterium]|nr:PIG-L family deacetylase [Thermoanaerobaculia bacterium]
MTTPADLSPPGRTTAVGARRVLVLAPHFDDEVLGCGGTLVQLVRSGAAVRVLFLSDGGALPEAEESVRRAYAARRREESAAALLALGITEAAVTFDLPDGRLEFHGGELAAGIRRELLAFVPDLVFVTSPLEVTGDHRAAFGALHAVLSVIRPEDGDALSSVVPALTVLAYEINHPAYPDVLVDVSAELPAIEAAMAAYSSQEERHAYLAAGLGLRRYRTLSLPASAGVAAAEGFRRLSGSDFVAHDLAELVAKMGGAAVHREVALGPLVSVIVRTKDRPALLAEALASLAASVYRRLEVVLVNDGGVPPEVPADFPFPVRRVDFPTNRGRAAAANAGVAAATGEWIGFLDDDDVVLPEHFAVLVAGAVGAGVQVVYADAAVVALELAPAGEQSPSAGGWREVERRLPYSRDFDLPWLLLDNYIPFMTALFSRSALAAVTADGGVLFDESLPIFEDWDLLIRLGLRTPFHHLRRTTASYRHFRGAGHHALGEHGTTRGDFLTHKARVIARHAAALTPERLAAAADRLRAAAVVGHEEALRLRTELGERDAVRAELETKHFALEDHFHRQHGELVAVTEERERLTAALAEAQAELVRVQTREAELAAVVEDQTDHLRRTYAEIERLNVALRALEVLPKRELILWWQNQQAKAAGKIPT